ncbi:hypothetical protein NKH77_32630 [Streptomyces sp. M19]
MRYTADREADAKVPSGPAGRRAGAATRTADSPGGASRTGPNSSSPRRRPRRQGAHHLPGSPSPRAGRPSRAGSARPAAVRQTAAPGTATRPPLTALVPGAPPTGTPGHVSCTNGLRVER